ncbi:MAG: YidC/Oxa1 family membrane protein insertase, partial [Aggregatilineales bacterium]
MWDIIINPFVTLLVLLYSLFGNNIVVTIVVFTIAIRMMTYPLLARSQESSKRMQELQPRIKKLQDKYKDDREKQQQAVMEVYKEAGVNPLGSCF